MIECRYAIVCMQDADYKVEATFREIHATVNVDDGRVDAENRDRRVKWYVCRDCIKSVRKRLSKRADVVKFTVTPL